MRRPSHRVMEKWVKKTSMKLEEVLLRDPEQMCDGLFSFKLINLKLLFTTSLQ